MTFFACRADGTQLGEFSEADFHDKVSARELSPEDYYWHEGMPDWKPIADYRLLAKTQRISFAPPPMRTTVKIDMEKSAPAAAKPQNFISRLVELIKTKK